MQWKILEKCIHSMFLYVKHIFIKQYFYYCCRITLKDVKAFLPKINCKIPTIKLREVFQEVDTKNRTEIGFDDFVILYHKLMFDSNVRKSILSILYILCYK
jgi:Ca2+-binding EF-hand superfamily protein